MHVLPCRQLGSAPTCLCNCAGLSLRVIGHDAAGFVSGDKAVLTLGLKKLPSPLTHGHIGAGCNGDTTHRSQQASVWFSKSDRLSELLRYTFQAFRYIHLAVYNG